MVLPDRFIALAEDHGIIHDLTLTVLDRALKDLAIWRAAGHHLDVSVNVSMADMAKLDFPDTLPALASAAGVPLAHLTLEVTESKVASDIRLALEILTRIRLKGVRLSIDDFGTGYSSLAQLRDIPFNELKLDRGFVSGSVADASLRAILDSSIDLASRLGLQTVAEGIEDEQQRRLLAAMGCELAQGRWLGPPMPADRLQAWAISANVRLHRHQSEHVPASCV
jgi:EAL domain-containing protein (putative c-di-GMP-specific phosphodiesterase class I)